MWDKKGGVDTFRRRPWLVPPLLLLGLGLVLVLTRDDALVRVAGLLMALAGLGLLMASEHATRRSPHPPPSEEG